MRRKLFGLAAVVLAVQAVPASAGLYTDDLTRCVVAKATDADKLAFVRWMFSAMSAHPGVKDLASSTPDERAALSKQAGNLITRLLTEDCRPQTLTALKYEGVGAITGSFEVLGKVAMQGLMSDPGVQQAMSGLRSPENDKKFEALGKEAGIPMPATRK
jgi:hypothetical protein